MTRHRDAVRCRAAAGESAGARAVPTWRCVAARALGQVPLRLALVSSRRIAAGEELLYDYAPGGDARLHVPYSGGSDSPAPDADPSAEPSQQRQAAPRGLVRCRCAHSGCRGWIF